MKYFSYIYCFFILFFRLGKQPTVNKFYRYVFRAEKKWTRNLCNKKIEKKSLGPFRMQIKYTHTEHM